jgi:hypothetical protein
MSFTLSVFAGGVPEDLKSRWERSLADYGLRAEFLPEFDPAHWPGGMLPARLEVQPGAFAAAGRYGAGPLIAAFEFYVMEADPEHIELLAQEASTEIRRRLETARKHFFFITSTGRSAADLRLQYFAAAVLAMMSGGVLVDCQSDRYLVGDAAIEAARAEADFFDGHEEAFRDWDSLAFPGWERLRPDD